MKGTPSGLDDSFMGTLAKDLAGGFGVGDAITGVVRGAYQATHHPLEALQEAGHQIIAIPGSLWEDMKAGKFGKLGARITEAAMLNPEATGKVATSVTEAAAPATAAVAEKVAPAVAVAKGAATGAVKEAMQPVTLNRYGIDVSVPRVAVEGAAGGAAARMIGLPATAGAAVGAARTIIRGALKGGKEALAARLPEVVPEASTLESSLAAAEQTLGTSLDDFSTAVAGKSYAKLDPESQAKVVDLYQKAAAAKQAPVPAPQPAPAETAPPAAVVPESRRLAAGPPLFEMPPATDTSYVRAVPAQYPEVITQPAVTPEPAPATTPALQLRDAIQKIEQRKAAATMPPEAAAMSPAEAEAVFQAQKARIQEGMTPPPEQPPAAPGAAKGPALLPLPEDVPPHYQALQQLEGTSAATRTYLKDRRIADYLLKKGVTPEQWEKMPLEDQNRLIVEAPSASGRGKHRPFVPKPEGSAPRAVGRWADEGVKDIADTMRWMQEQAAAAKASQP